MAKLIFVLYLDTMDEYPRSALGDFLEINPRPGAQDVPSPVFEGTTDGMPVFKPNPDLALP